MLEIYLIILNILGFILYCINKLLYKFTQHSLIDKVLIITSFLGGSLGTVVAILLFDRTNEKDNMMLRVFVICMFVIQLVLFIITKIDFSENFTLAIWKIFDKYKILLVYLFVINIVTLIVFILDKINAILKKRRYKIVTLLGLCFIGGSLGGLVAMYVFRHKTQQEYFTVGVPLIIITQIIVIIFLANIT